MTTDKSITIAFTGHRSNRITTDTQTLITQIEKAITDLYFKGFKRFLSGMSEGFDLLSAESVLKLKTIYPDIELITVIPFTRQASRYSQADQNRYERILKQCDDRILISEHYFMGCFHRRNDCLIEKASLVVAYFDGECSGGTYYTIEQAIKKRLPIINL